MRMKFRGDFDKLKECVSGTGLDGRWTKLSNGHRQFITDNGGILNWAPSTGSVWFQGEESAADNLELEFMTAAEGRIKPRYRKPRSAPDGKDIGALKELLADTLIENARLRRRFVG
jgi:hypothetical protein